MNLSKEDKQELYYCICCRLGIIETGDPTMRASDAIKQGQHKMIKPLDTNQMKLIMRLDEIKNSLLGLS